MGSVVVVLILLSLFALIMFEIFKDIQRAEELENEFKSSLNIDLSSDVILGS